MRGQLLGQCLVVYSHRIAIYTGARAGGDCHSGEGRPGFVALPGHAGDYPNSCIVLVEGVRKLIACLRELLLQLEGLQGEGVPFILEGGQEGGD